MHQDYVAANDVFGLLDFKLKSAIVVHAKLLFIEVLVLFYLV